MKNNTQPLSVGLKTELNDNTNSVEHLITQIRYEEECISDMNQEIENLQEEISDLQEEMGEDEDLTKTNLNLIYELECRIMDLHNDISKGELSIKHIENSIRKLYTMTDYKQIAKDFSEADQECSKGLITKPIFNWLEELSNYELSEDELYLFTMAAYQIRDEVDRALNAE